MFYIAKVILIKTLYLMFKYFEEYTWYFILTVYLSQGVAYKIRGI